jgi:hypothetical protein
VIASPFEASTLEMRRLRMITFFDWRTNKPLPVSAALLSLPRMVLLEPTRVFPGVLICPLTMTILGSLPARALESSLSDLTLTVGPPLPP